MIACVIGISAAIVAVLGLAAARALISFCSLGKDLLVVGTEEQTRKRSSNRTNSAGPIVSFIALIDNRSPIRCSRWEYDLRIAEYICLSAAWQLLPTPVALSAFVVEICSSILFI